MHIILRKYNGKGECAMKTGRFRFNRKNVLMLGAAAALAPMMAASVASAVPSAADCVTFAAEASARLAAGNVYVREQVTAEKTSAEAAAEEDKPDTANAYLSLDDSFMLSRGELLIPSGENEEIEVPKEHDSGAEPYPESLESRDGVISALTYGFYQGDD